MSQLTDIVLHVLASQAEGYLIQPDAAAFVVQGLSPEEVAVALQELADDGHAQRTEVVAQIQKRNDDGEPEVDPKTGEAVLEDLTHPDGDPVVIGEGWELGKKATAKVVKAARGRLEAAAAETTS